MADNAITAVVHRNQFYRDNYRRAMIVLLLSILLNSILAGTLIYIVTNPPQPKYFPTSVNGRITPLLALDQPNQTDSAVLQWANQAATAAYSYNWLTYRKELQAASEFFTRSGWRDFLQALQESNTLEAVTSKKLIVSAVATRAPTILDKGVMNGVYTWRVQIPLLVTFQSGSEFTQQNNIVTMTIVRVSSLSNPRGIGISQFLVAPA